MPKKKHVKAAGANAKSRSTRFSSTSGGVGAGGDGEAKSSLPTSESQRPKRGKRAAAADGADTKPPPAAKRKYTRKPVTKTKQYDYLNDIDSLAKTRSAKVCANRWSSILMARDNRKRAIMLNDAHKKDVDALFDCSDLIIPPTAGLLDREAEKAIEKWKALDSRVVKTDFDDDDDGVGKSDGVSADGSHKSVGGRPIKERMLPPNFDYQCRNKPPDEEDEDNNNIGNTEVDGTNNKRRKRVISLLDPTQTQDYESELWKVFNSMPTAKEVEHQYALGSSDEAAADGDNDTTSPSVNHGCQHTLTITNTLDKLRRKYTRIDAHSLGRLRIRDRHASMYNYSGEDTAAVSHNSSSSLQTTLRFEILKPNVEDLRRGSGPDGNRLEVELHGSQHTLLDLHHTLVEHASINTDGGEAADISAGVFLVEDILYTHGDVGNAAADSILEWMDEFNSKQGGKKEEAALSSTTPDDARDGKVQSKPKVVPMDGIKLEDLTLRLGVRYTHINLQSSEIGNSRSWDQSSASALFVTGIQSHPIPSSSSPESGEQEQNDGQSTNNRVPIIIHDIWTSSQQSQTHTMCAACNYLPATVATVNDVMTDASLTFPSSENNSSMGTPLCAPCFRELHYQRSDDSGDLLQLRSNRSQLK
eukprot:scaffold10792_cov139-Skeletonema_dohrnii-CCMP3373.AAC.1